jgi:hypothetical protein
MRCILLTIIISSLFLSTTVADQVASPDEFVELFLARDLAGDRLNADTGPGSMAEMIAWDKNPNWQVLVVVKSYQRQAARRAPDGLRAMTEYQVLGELVGGHWIPRKKQKTERVSFLLMRQEGAWKIKKPVFPPHISLERAIAEVKSRLAAAGESELRAPLKNSLTALEQLRQKE